MKREKIFERINVKLNIRGHSIKHDDLFLSIQNLYQFHFHLSPGRM
jgi:hypothetical protein